MAISIIVPIYNTPKQYLQKCFQSIIYQKMTEFEVIIVDDGSDKDIAEFIDEYSKTDERFRVIHKQNEGVSAARNTGLDYVRGEYVTFVDADDFLDSGMLKRLVELAEEYSADCVMCHHDRIVEDRHIPVAYVGKNIELFSHEQHNILQEMLLGVTWYQREYVFHTLPCTWGKIYRFSRIQSNRFPTGVHNGEDAIFTFSCMDSFNKTVISSEVLYHYRQWEGSAAHAFKKETINSWLNNRRDFRNLIEQGNYSPRIRKAYDEHALGVMKLVLFTVFAHPDNKGQLGRNDLKDFTENPLMWESISRLKVGGVIDKKSKFVLLMIHRRWYGLLIAMTKLRLRIVNRT
ncbi:MAG: glycosyltransferase [Muribaculaceae bacterium]|nr:glycosyltransferase [Roseburia sp.]MCM1431231.1 glycosyltransferase [Muribaculaceae bacterium]MCM1492283.1 glycosyltransferase [Muribaculaceae bacterium]